MKKPLKNVDGSFVNAENGSPRRFTKRAALHYGKGSYHLGSPKVSVRDAGSYWVLERGGQKNKI